MNAIVRRRRNPEPPSPRLGPGPSISDISDTSDNILIDGPYAHLIDIRYLPNLDCRVYSCKEHPPPDTPEYYDLKGIMISHFKPFHGPKS